MGPTIQHGDLRSRDFPRRLAPATQSILGHSQASARGRPAVCGGRLWPGMLAKTNGLSGAATIESSPPRYRNDPMNSVGEYSSSIRLCRDRNAELSAHVSRGRPSTNQGVACTHHATNRLFASLVTCYHTRSVTRSAPQRLWVAADTSHDCLGPGPRIRDWPGTLSPRSRHLTFRGYATRRPSTKNNGA
jgi:hypothetical protein